MKLSQQDNELDFITVDNDDDDGVMTQSYGVATSSGSQQGNVIGSWIADQSKHPIVLGFHMLFKSLALFIYLFGSWFTSNFIFNFVLCIVFLAFDFWTVKNVSGRLLVGLRWWSYVRDDGTNEWVFESLEDMSDIGSFDSRVFWGTLYGFPLSWAALFVIGVLRLKFEYMPVVIAALAMNGANLIGYYKCSGDAQGKVRTLLHRSNVVRNAAMNESGITSWLLSSAMSMVLPTSGTASGSNSGSGAVVV